MKNEIKQYLNIEYSFERRRYGVAKFFTWLNYRVKGTQEWLSYGDPWPKARLNRHELIDALNSVVVQSTKPGTRVRTQLGEARIVDADGGDGCFSAYMDIFTAVRPLHPNMIVEVLA